MTFLRGAVAALMLTPAISVAQDVQKGLDAAQAGDFETALREWKPLVQEGDADAQFNLGVMYDRGLGVLQDYGEAVKLYRLAAQQGNARAQYNLGIMYGNGKGVEQSHSTAHMWFNIAAANGIQVAPEKRDMAEKRMTSDAVVEAQQRARACMASDYQDCN